MKAQEHNTSINGQPVQYWDTGEGNDSNIILLHGGIGDAPFNWEPTIDSLADNYRIVAPELPGFGGTALPPEMRISTLVDWTQGIINTLEIAPVTIVGHSLVGGLLARMVAVTHPETTRALVLVNGGAVPSIPPAMRSVLGGLSRIPGLGGASSGLLARLLIPPKQMVYAKEVLTDDFQRQVKESRKHLGDLTQAVIAETITERAVPAPPTLLLWGSEDAAFPLDEAHRVQHSMPGSELETIAECGHMPQLEAVDAFATQIDLFLTRLDRASRRSNLPGAGRL